MNLKHYLTTKTLRKVPEVTLLFWVTKLLTTAMGEATSDFLVHRLDPVIAVLIGAVAFGIAIVLQFIVKKYVPWIYWLTVTSVAIFGTMAADVLHIGLGIPYIISCVLFGIILILVFSIWRRIEGTLSIHSITSPRRELFYWLTVTATFALGTALGDLTAVTLHLGYLTSGVLFGILFATPLVGFKLLKWNEILTFWFAYIMTRPLGASFADWFGKTKPDGGIGVGSGLTSIFLTMCIVLLVLSMTRKSSRP